MCLEEHHGYFLEGYFLEGHLGLLLKSHPGYFLEGHLGLLLKSHPGYFSLMLLPSCWLSENNNKLKNIRSFKTINALAKSNILINMSFVISRRVEGPGREILKCPPSVCLSVTFSFRTVTRKCIDVCCIVFYIGMLFEFCMNFFVNNIFFPVFFAFYAISSIFISNIVMYRTEPLFIELTMSRHTSNRLRHTSNRSSATCRPACHTGHQVEPSCPETTTTE